MGKNGVVQCAEALAEFVEEIRFWKQVGLKHADQPFSRVRRARQQWSRRFPWGMGVVNEGQFRALMADFEAA